MTLSDRRSSTVWMWSAGRENNLGMPNGSRSVGQGVDPKSFQLSADVYDYILAHSRPPDPVEQDLIAETMALGPEARMMIAPEQAVFMGMLVRLIGARRALEVGTFTGYSALAVARNLPADGYVLCCDINGDWTAVARRYWQRAGVDHKIELRLAPALDTLRSLPRTDPFDLIFIDAEKTEYIDYYHQAVELVSPAGVILVDNTLAHGAVIDPADDSERTAAIRRFNDLAASDERTESVLLPIADGLMLITPRT